MFNELEHRFGYKTNCNKFLLRKWYHTNLDKSYTISYTIRYWYQVNNTRLSNPWVKEEVSKEIRKYFVKNDNKNKTCQGFLDACKLILEGNIMA